LISYDGSLTNLTLFEANGVPSFCFFEPFCNYFISWGLNDFAVKKSGTTSDPLPHLSHLLAETGQEAQSSDASNGGRTCDASHYTIRSNSTIGRGLTC